MDTTHAHRRGILPIGFVVSVVACAVSWRYADASLSIWFSEWNRAWTDAPFVLGLRQLGKVWALAWLLLLWVTVTRRTRPVTTAFLALVFTAVLVLPLKESVGRIRPGEYLDLPIEKINDIPIAGHSFPSGDVATVCAVTFSLICVLSWRTWTVLLGLCLLSGVLRLVVLAHHLSDLWAGAAVGILCAYLALRLDHSGFFDSSLLDRRIWMARTGLVALPVLWCIEGLVPVLTFAVTIAPVAILLAVGSRWRSAEIERLQREIDSVKEQ
ncbi:MAG: phosphatase PAP2 family protein [Planctomycetes bacterium]|nr:phosphatase PAP2 family protein [Planctomycetota bacterium]